MNHLNRSALKSQKSYPERIIQFGEGNFLRAFVDWQVHIMNNTLDFNTGVVVVQPIEKGLIDLLAQQDNLYTVYLQGIKNGSPSKDHSVVDCITRCINPYENFDAYLKLAENPEMRFIISNTTESGIAFEPSDKLSSAPPKSYPAKLTSLLYHRYKYFSGDTEKGFIIIPCELIDRNGEKLQQVVLQLCQLWNLEETFVTWIKESCTFCCSLVDRIVTGFPRDTINEITSELGYKDNAVVVGEQFHLWVIEAPDFVAEEFPAHKADLNTLIVKDMTPYRTRKVRILNGSHTALTPVAYLYGIETVGEAISHQVVGKFVKELISEEIVKTIDLPADELNYFANEVIDRFSNPFIEHYVMSISLNSWSKYKARNLPTLLDYLEREQELPKRMVFALAALISFYKGKRDNGEAISLLDEQEILALFENLWNRDYKSESDLTNICRVVLSSKLLWDRDLNEIPNLTKSLSKYLFSIENKGIKEAIEDIL